jgi:hypothetical protein
VSPQCRDLISSRRSKNPPARVSASCHDMWDQIGKGPACHGQHGSKPSTAESCRACRSSAATQQKIACSFYNCDAFLVPPCHCHHMDPQPFQPASHRASSSSARSLVGRTASHTAPWRHDRRTAARLWQKRTTAWHLGQQWLDWSTRYDAEARIGSGRQRAGEQVSRGGNGRRGTALVSAWAGREVGSGFGRRGKERTCFVH